MVTNPDPTKPDDRTGYALLGCGKSIRATTFAKIKPSLAPLGDGLFGDDLSQTFAWVE